jgi:Na+-driven multidrug efflux pump
VSVTAIKIFAFSYLAGWIDMCFSSYFTALEMPVRSLVVSLFGTIIFPIAFLFILTSIWGLNGVWLMASAAAVSSGTLTLILASNIKRETGMILYGSDDQAV